MKSLKMIDSEAGWPMVSWPKDVDKHIEFITESRKGAEVLQYYKELMKSYISQAEAVKYYSKEYREAMSRLFYLIYKVNEFLLFDLDSVVETYQNTIDFIMRGAIIRDDNSRIYSSLRRVALRSTLTFLNRPGRKYKEQADTIFKLAIEGAANEQEKGIYQEMFSWRESWYYGMLVAGR